jgi:hypothetical protein
MIRLDKQPHHSPTLHKAARDPDSRMRARLATFAHEGNRPDNGRSRAPSTAGRRADVPGKDGWALTV